MIGIAGNDQAAYAKRDYDEAMRVQLDVGILDYCRIEDRRLELLFVSIEGATFVEQILRDTQRLAHDF